MNKLNLMVMQDAINNLETDNQRKNSKKVLVDMLEKAYASDLIVKNIAKQINTDITREEKKMRRVLTVEEQEIFLKEAENTIYYYLFIVALETGMRLGDDDDKIRLNQRKPSKYKGLRRFGPEKKLATNQQIYEGKAYLL